MIKKILGLAIFSSLFSLHLLAADFEFGTISHEEISMKSYPADVNAHAVVLNEYGRSSIIPTENRALLVYEYHVRIKFFDNHDFKDHANVEVLLYKGNGDNFEEITKVKGVTFSPDGSGGVNQTDLDPKKVFVSSANKYYNLAKFAMPGVKDGSVIEYTYTVTSPYIFNFRQWDFQSDIPKVKSAYKVEIPGIYNYNILLRGGLQLSKTDAELQRDCFSLGGIKCDCSEITYNMEKIPAFVEEDYMTARKNFLSAVYFELSDYINLNTGVKTKVTKEWRDIDAELKGEDEFGSQIKRSGLMKDRIASVIAGKPDALAKAQAIYAFVQKNIKWNGFYSKYSDDGIKKALDTHSGAIGDINLTLIAALNAAGINTDAVMLSTRDHGAVNKLYPTISDFNYVIAKVVIDGKTYYLDASEPLLGFGMLPIRCINDQGRVLSMTHPSEWIDITEPKKKSEVTSLDLTLGNDGKMRGTYTRYSLGYGGFEKRKAIKKFNTTDEYIESLDEKLHKVKILKSAIANLDSLDSPLSETYEIEVNAYDNLNKDRLAFSPFIFGHNTVNPFKLANRDYPVDMGMPSDERYILTLHLPDGYEVETAPQNIGLTMPNNGGSLIADFQNTDNAIKYSEAVRFAKPVYSSAEYPYLKEIFNKIILAEKTEIVIRKKAK